MLPETLIASLQEHFLQIREIHIIDLKDGFTASMPDALVRKYPNASKQWGWQYLFHGADRAMDPRTGK